MVAAPPTPAPMAWGISCTEPSTATEPSDGRSAPAMRFSRVVFPTPLGPMSAA